MTDRPRIIERPWNRYREGFVKNSEQGAREGTPFIADHIIKVTEVAFDDFAGGQTVVERNRKILGLS